MGNLGISCDIMLKVDRVILLQLPVYMKYIDGRAWI